MFSRFSRNLELFFGSMFYSFKDAESTFSESEVGSILSKNAKSTIKKKKERKKKSNAHPELCNRIRRCNFSDTWENFSYLINRVRHKKIFFYNVYNDKK